MRPLAGRRMLALSAGRRFQDERDPMHEPEAPRAQRSHAPPTIDSIDDQPVLPPVRDWTRPTARATTTARLVQWLDENGSVVRLIATNTPEDEASRLD
jgi:hypothetical protein